MAEEEAWSGFCPVMCPYSFLINIKSELTDNFENNGTTWSFCAVGSSNCDLRFQHKFNCFLLKNSHNNAQNAYIQRATAGDVYPQNCEIGASVSEMVQGKTGYVTNNPAHSIGSMYAYTVNFGTPDRPVYVRGHEGAVKDFYTASWTARYWLIRLHPQ